LVDKADAMTALTRHPLCRRDPLPALYRRAARIVAAWRADRYDALIVDANGAVRPTRYDEIPRSEVVVAIDLGNETRAVWEVARRLGRGLAIGTDKDWSAS
jgi:hypothetical protein